jgi:carboxyl-terminal processing protease
VRASRQPRAIPCLVSGKKLVLLVNGNTASAGELVAQAVSEATGVPLVGTATTAKAVGQRVVPTPGGTELLVTDSRFLSGKGVWLGDVGVTTSNPVVPGHPVEQQDPNCEFGSDQDTQFQAALELLK